MRTLIFDTETTGFPMRGRPQTDHGQPWVVELAAVLLDADLRERGAVHFIVRPPVPIPEGVSKVHGITDAVALAYGVPARAALGAFLRLLAHADVVAAHNAAFDVSLVEMGCARSEGVPMPKWPLVRCTAEASAPICNIPPTARMLEAGIDRPKTPKLAEAYEHLVGGAMAGAHSAMGDVRACVKVYAALLARGAWKEAA